MKILTVVGARPQFIKASSFSRALDKFNKNHSQHMNEIIIHTGQHFDQNMSDIFFSELEIPEPKYNLNISNLSHGAMTGRMLEELENIFVQENPDSILVYGDTNSTLAAALAASKLAIPLLHIESGLRSYNMNMPEEVNRVLTDKLSSYLFCPSKVACDNLTKEGIRENIHFVGDVMFDVVLHLKKSNHLKPFQDLSLKEREYCICTLHRQENTDDPVKMRNILESLQIINKDIRVVMPIHPRTKKIISDYDQNDLLKGLNVITPISYKQMLSLLDNSSFLITDSGGMQKEAMYLKKPCLTLRDETEWTETVDLGFNTLCGSDPDMIINSYNRINNEELSFNLNPYGEGDAAEKIIQILNKK
jgi:UDP-GlcNAc3NAcA epimerase